MDETDSLIMNCCCQGPSSFERGRIGLTGDGRWQMRRWGVSSVKGPNVWSFGGVERSMYVWEGRGYGKCVVSAWLGWTRGWGVAV